MWLYATKGGGTWLNAEQRGGDGVQRGVAALTLARPCSWEVTVLCPRPPACTPYDQFKYPQGYMYPRLTTSGVMKRQETKALNLFLPVSSSV